MTRWPESASPALAVLTAATASPARPERSSAGPSAGSTAGSSRRVRYRAYVRRAELSVLREFEAAKARWREDLMKWQVDRILTASKLLGIPVERVTAADILTCYVVHGVPSAPQLVMRTDRRYGRMARDTLTRGGPPEPKAG